MDQFYLRNRAVAGVPPRSTKMLLGSVIRFKEASDDLALPPPVNPDSISVDRYSKEYAMPEDNEGQVKPLATAEQLVAIMLPDANQQVKDGLSTIREAIISTAPMTQQFTGQTLNTDHLDKFLELANEILMAPDIQKAMAAALLKSVRQSYSPEQIDTLVNFYTENPWALECQTKMAAQHTRNLAPINATVVQRVSARLPDLMSSFGFDLPDPWTGEGDDGS